MKSISIRGQVVVVTGAASGIGRATAELFASEGAAVHAVDLDADGLDQLVDSNRHQDVDVQVHTADVADAASMQAVARAVLQQRRRIDALVNSAGISHIGTLESTSEEDLDRTYRVNVKGTYQACRVLLPAMLEQSQGVIVNLASIASLIGIKDRFAYSITKGAVLSLTRSIAVDYMSKGIRCNCICPARVHTPFVDGFLRRNYPGREAEMFAELSAYQPIGRMAHPEEVAAMALYLCSDAAQFITGQALPLDGGVLVM